MNFKNWKCRNGNTFDIMYISNYSFFYMAVICPSFFVSFVSLFYLISCFFFQYLYRKKFNDKVQYTCTKFSLILLSSKKIHSSQVNNSKRSIALSLLSSHRKMASKFLNYNYVHYIYTFRN